jgi:hypothetical protein
MMAELKGVAPKIPYALTKTLINRALRTICAYHLWSFNLFESAWITPPVVTAGLATVVQGGNTVTFDATATTALTAASSLYSLITQRQFRVGIGGIYNIITWDVPSSTATLDRVYADPSAAGVAYQVYQVYYPAPIQDFLSWISIRNPLLSTFLDTTKNRDWVDAQDPQRTAYSNPTHVLPYGIDNRVGSGTIGFPLFELWGQPISSFTYQTYGIRRGTNLVAPTDTLPFAIGEDLVIAKAKQYAYEWAEANKDTTPQQRSPDFRFLMGKADDEFKALMTQYKRMDREYVNLWFTQRMPWMPLNSYYSTLTGYASTRAPSY